MHATFDLDLPTYLPTDLLTALNFSVDIKKLGLLIGSPVANYINLLAASCISDEMSFINGFLVEE